MKISACWIVKDEAEELALSIKSVMHLADEMIVVDTGSTDDSVKVARELGAATYDFEWINDFAAARNYALSFATGDVVIFLDADEYFSPALEPEIRPQIEHYFKASKADTISVKRTDINKDTGLTIDTGNSLRFIRTDRDLYFKDAIHESVAKKSGAFPVTVMVMEWNINHTGYSPERIARKVKRNIELLEADLERTTDPYQRFLTQAYLLRETYSIGEMDKANEHFRAILPQGAFIERACKSYGIEYIRRIFMAIDLAARYRGGISRKDIYRKLVAVIKNVYPGTMGAAIADLRYVHSFGVDEREFLGLFDPAMKKALALEQGADLMNEYKTARASLYERATLSAWLRGDKLKAFDYAIEGAKNFKRPSSQALLVLLDCMKGQPPEDIVLFLSNIYDIKYEAVLPFLTNSLRLQDYKILYLYYQKKQIDRGTATKGDYLYLLLLTSDYMQSVEAALEMNDDNNSDAVRDHLFMTAICSDNESIFTDNRELLEPYAHILEAFFNGTPLEVVEEADAAILNNFYQYIAFARNLETADRFREVFEQNPAQCFVIKASYCLQNNLYDEILDEDRSGLNPFDLGCSLPLIRSYIAVGEYDEAYDIIDRYFASGAVSSELLQMLLIVCDLSKGTLRQQAKDLYDENLAVLDEMVDLNDVLATKIVFRGKDKKEKQILKNMKLAELDKLIAADAQNHPPQSLLYTLALTAPVYEEMGADELALACYRRMVAHDYSVAKNLRHLIRLFEKFGNPTIAAQLEERLPAPEEESHEADGTEL